MRDKSIRVHGMRSPHDIGIELRTRDFHTRQYLGVARFDVWADGKCYGSFTTPQESEMCVRNLIGITPEEGSMLDAYVEKMTRAIRGEAVVEGN
jgi:hypothetical protein